MQTRLKHEKDCTVKYKRCRVCGEWLPISRFGKNARRKDGYCNRCRICASAYHRKMYALRNQRI